MLCEFSCLVSYHSDRMVCVVSALMYKFPFWREKCFPGSGIGTGVDLHRGKILSSWKQPLCTTASKRKTDLLPLRTYVNRIATGSLQLVAIIAPCTTAVKSAGDGFLKYPLGPRHSWCNRMILLNTLFLRSEEHRIRLKQILRLFPLCILWELYDATNRTWFKAYWNQSKDFYQLQWVLYWAPKQLL